MALSPQEELQRLAAENLQLREAVKLSKTELGQKNRELEIEAALERVRTSAMAMKKPEDMLSVCRVIFQQLESLGVKNIRNVQTIILNDPLASYTNYEYFNLYDKEIIIDVAYSAHPIIIDFLKQIRTSDDYFFFSKLDGETLTDWRQYLKTGQEKVDPRLESASAMYYYMYSIGPGALGVSTYDTPMPDEDVVVLKRFRNVFQLAYRRYSDIEQAEAQAREAQIEVALERVRSKAMAMHKSDDLNPAIATVFEELDKLNLGVQRCGIGILNKDNYKVDVWTTALTDQGKTVQVSGDESMDIHPLLMGAYDAWLEQRDYSYVLKGDDLLDYYRALTTTNFRLPDAVQISSNTADRQQFYYNAIFQFGGLFAFRETEFPEEAKKVMKRFAEVFNLTYKRFLDLHKAEAQTRKAQIEAALERVRSRTMGMQKSEELKEVIQVVYDQFVHLNMHVEHTGFVMDYKARDDYNIWVADPLGVPSQVIIPYFDCEYYNRFNEAKEKGEDFFATNLSFEEKNKFYQTLFEHVPGLPEESKRFYFSCPGLAASTVLLDNVCLYIENFSGTPYTDEENEVLMRFGKVFQQTYTRFLDLQKAESQAREARIETALERTRTQSMIMQHSKELDDTLRVFHEQVLSLNILSAFSFLWLPDEEKDRHIFWAAWGENKNDLPVFKSKTINYSLDRNEPATAQCLVDWKSNEPVYSYHVRPEGVGNYFAAWQELIEGVEQLKPEYFSGGLYYVEAFMKYGCFGVMVTTDLTEDEKKILGRFAIEFERTYTRFLDLQKAEMQAREAKIETALERVRAKAMAMHSSEDLATTVDAFFGELGLLQVMPRRCGVTLIDENSPIANITATTATKGGESKIIVGKLSLTGHPVLEEVYDHWKAQSEYHPILRGAEIKAYYEAMNPQVNYPDFTADEIQYGHYFFFKEGGVFAWTDLALPEESIQIFRKFTSVLSLTYRRYLDLTEAEQLAEQAREDLIKLQIEKKRAEEALTELRATQAQLIQSEKMASLGELTAGIAHEIQNPLNFVKNFSEVNAELIDELNDELATGNVQLAKEIAGNIKENEEKIVFHGKRADAIVKGMLQHSRSSSSVKEPTDINALADEYLRLAYHGLRAKDKTFNATMKTDFDPTIGLINIVPQDIGRVILNLITNAFYAVSAPNPSAPKSPKGDFMTPKGVSEPTVIVSTKLKKSPLGDLGAGVEIRVTDNGPGIPDSIKDKIFQPFFTTKPTGQGTGLGLSLSYDIIKAHGGELKVETKEGEGTTFIIQLPVNDNTGRETIEKR